MPGLSTAPPEGDFKPDSSGVVLSPGIYARADRRLSRQPLSEPAREKAEARTPRTSRTSQPRSRRFLSLLSLRSFMSLLFSSPEPRATNAPSSCLPRRLLEHPRQTYRPDPPILFARVDLN